MASSIEACVLVWSGRLHPIHPVRCLSVRFGESVSNAPSADSRGGHADVGSSEAESSDPSTHCSHHCTRPLQEEEIPLEVAFPAGRSGRARGLKASCRVFCAEGRRKDLHMLLS